MAKSFANFTEPGHPEPEMGLLEWQRSQPDEIVERRINNASGLDSPSSFDRIDVSSIAEDLEICREQIATFMRGREYQASQEVAQYRQEIKACHQELALLNQEVASLHQELEAGEQNVILLGQLILRLV